MHRIVPHGEPYLFIDNWLVSVSIIIDIAVTFPHVRVIFFENLIERKLGPLLLTLGCSSLEDRPDIGPTGVTTSDEFAQEYWEQADLTHYAALIEEMHSWYNELVSAFDDETGMSKPMAKHDRIDELRLQLGLLRNNFWEITQRS